MPDDVKVTGPAAVSWVEDALWRGWLESGERRRALLAEAGRRFVVLRPEIERWAAHQRTVDRLHEISTDLRHLENDLRAKDALPPQRAVDPDETARELEQALTPPDPLAPLAGREFDVEFLGIRRALGGGGRAVFELHGEMSYTLHVWHPWSFRGAVRLSQARVLHAKYGVRIEGREGAFELGGRPILMPGVEREPGPDWLPQVDPARTDRWPDLVALVDRVNARARWDYEIEDVGGSALFALRGTSGAYDDGCVLSFEDVFAFDLPARFSHATFRLLRDDEVPVPLRPPVPGWIALGVEAEARGSGSSARAVVCRALTFSDADGADSSVRVGEGRVLPPRPPPEPLVAVAAAQDPVVRSLLVSLRSFAAPDKTAPGRALWALREHWPVVEGPPSDEPMLGGVAKGLLRALRYRATFAEVTDDAAEFVTDPFAPLARREAQRREADALLRSAAEHVRVYDTESDESAYLLDDDASACDAGNASEALVREARALVVREVVRRQLGLEPRGLALDLDHQTVGRVLADPAADASLSDEEKLARAAELVVLDPAESGSPVGLDRLLPDPVQRARVASVVPFVKALLPRVDPVAHALAESGALDRFEVTALLDRDDEVREWFVLLRGLLRGHAALPAR